MCDYCSIGTQYIIYRENHRDSGVLVCHTHITQAIENLSQYLFNSQEHIIVERIEN